jgi:type I restriction enzyme S subunit
MASHYKTVRLGDLLRLRKDVVHPRNKPTGKAQFVGLEHIESVTGRRLGSVELDMARLTGRKPQFRRGDIVYGYLRPYLNKVWVAEFDGLCSVDQYVYEVNEELADADFVAWFMRSPTYLRRAPIDATPGQLPRIRTEEVASVHMDLPARNEQRRVAASLQNQMAEVGRAQVMVQEQWKLAARLRATVLRKVFEGPEARDWPTRRIEDLAETCSGATPPRANRAYYGGAIPWIKTGELKDSVIRETEEHVSEAALRDTSLRLLPVDTLLVAMYGQGQTRGRTGLLAIPASTNQACFAILPNERFDPRFLQFWFCHSYARLREQTEGRGGNQPNLNGVLLRQLSVPVPRIEVQRQVVERLDAEIVTARKAQRALEEKLATLESLPARLLARAFGGHEEKTE